MSIADDVKAVLQTDPAMVALLATARSGVLVRDDDDDAAVVWCDPEASDAKLLLTQIAPVLQAEHYRVQRGGSLLDVPHPTSSRPRRSGGAPFLRVRRQDAP